MDNSNNAIMTPYAQSYRSQESGRTRWGKIIIVVLIIVAVIVTVTCIIALTDKSKGEVSADEFTEHAFDEFAEEEELNDEYAKAAASNSHADYETKRTMTRYVGYSPMEMCKAAALDCPRVLKDPDESMKIGAINSKAMDYYLDNGKVLVMIAKYDKNSTPTPTVIYARNENVYLAFNPQRMNDLFYATRWQLLDPVVGVPVFYALE